MSTDDNLKQIRKMLDQYNEYSKPLKEAMVTTAKQLEVMFSKERLAYYQKSVESFRQKYEDTVRILASIDWQEIYDGLSQVEKEILTFSNELNKERIYLNHYYFGSVTLDKIDTLLDREFAIAWMNENIKGTVDNLANKEYLAKHKKLIIQSYKAYENGDYELAILGIIPSLEFFMGNWLVSDKHHGEFDLENPSRSQMKKSELEKILNEHPDKDKKSLTMDHYFEMKAMHGVIEFYDGSKDNRVSRNSIVHGSHDYSNLESLDYIKLVYLFNSLIPLYGVDLRRHKK